MASPARADFSDMFIDPEDGMLDASQYLVDHTLGFLPVPSIITEPAVGFGLGMMGLFFHESKAQREQREAHPEAISQAVLPSDISILGGAATTNGTWGVGGGHIGFWKEDTIRYKVFGGYSSLNLDFYSLGGRDLPEAVELNITGPAIVQNLAFRLGDSNLFLGANQMYRRVETSYEGGGVIPVPPEFLDYIREHFDFDTTTSGIGLNAEYDSVDNKFNPGTGYNWSAKWTWFNDAIGSNVDYSAYKLTALNYWALSEKFNLGFRVQYDGVSADDDARLPTYVPPFIDLRGIPKSRYQGTAVAVAEVQLGWKLDHRWTLIGFTGAGRAAQSFGDLSDASTEATYGTGFRYLIAKRFGFAMGADIARGPEETAFYIQAGSTW
ncbi:BamA/TamA family outer membrane protein [Marinihelvus fidelis]|uniref:BamA/TamA family outer membrane protein n=2 Tax=Marinihelvus fidelis TaxID=2613842 RepID=A0A5N0TGP0_9GAMM|nr:BamA/TamA family outer membrane protein [Marinihelvus fidelis]